jgi:hypothetical protein
LTEDGNAKIGGRGFREGYGSRTLFALALRSPAPAPVHPGPSARVFAPMPGSEDRAAGGLDKVRSGPPDIFQQLGRSITARMAVTPTRTAASPHSAPTGATRAPVCGGTLRN